MIFWTSGSKCVRLMNSCWLFWNSSRLVLASCFQALVKAAVPGVSHAKLSRKGKSGCVTKRLTVPPPGLLVIWYEP